MALDGVLANIPGLAGYLAQQQFDQRQALGGMQGIMQMMQAVEQAKTAPLRQQLMQSQVSEAQRATAEREQLATRLADIQRRFGPRTEQVMDTLPDDEMTGTPAQQVQRTVQRPMDIEGMAGEMALTPGLQGVGVNLLSTVEARKGRQEQARLAQQTELTRLQAQMQDRALTREQQERISQRMEQLRRDMADQASQDRFALRAASGSGQPRAPVGYRFSADGETLEPIPGGPKAPGSKAMPTTALRMQREELDAIGMASSISSDLAALSKQITDGDLKLGPVANLVAQGRNFAGVSTKETRNYATFLATLEKLRNDSLRLNKGVQTEGDAVRAWNELIKSPNDPAVVQQRIAEIVQINKRAADLRRMNIDIMRSNYGVGPLDVSEFENQPAAVGARGASGSWDGPKPSKAAMDRLRGNPAERAQYEAMFGPGSAAQVLGQ